MTLKSDFKLLFLQMKYITYTTNVQNTLKGKILYNMDNHIHNINYEYVYIYLNY